jgi:hypothetical protein
MRAMEPHHYQSSGFRVVVFDAVTPDTVLDVTAATPNCYQSLAARAVASCVHASFDPSWVFARCPPMAFPDDMVP